MFALGDIIDWPEQKQAAKTKAHADVVAANIQSYLTGQPLSKVYKGSPEMIVVPLGKASHSLPAFHALRVDRHCFVERGFGLFGYSLGSYRG